jgi:hypothetical protein
MVIILCLSSTLPAQIADFFDGTKEYHFNAIYIDSIGDTVTREKIIVQPTGKPWVAQPGLQKSFSYIYDANMVDYANYVDPEAEFRKRDLKYFRKKGKYRYSKEETTGGFVNESEFYMHPPRRNQYRMLVNGVHPFFYFESLSKKHHEFNYSHIKFIGMGSFDHNYIVDSLGAILFQYKEIAAWQVQVQSDFLPATDFWKTQKYLFDSKLDAIFTTEYGFIKLHYTFKTGIKIQFDLIEVKEI